MELIPGIYIYSQMVAKSLERKPAWLKRKIPGGPEFAGLANLIRNKNLNTVCQSANCPNIGECWNQSTATFMILGNTCTRGCRFCDVPKGKPGFTDWQEPQRVAESAKNLNLKHVVLTSVNRDDLEDQGSEIWRQTILAVKEALPACTVETLIPDFQGNSDLVEVVLSAKPEILNHNFETVARLQKQIRGRGNLKDSSLVLSYAKSRGFITKTSLILGLGETRSETEEMIEYIAKLNVDILTLGQYLQPSFAHHPVAEYIEPRVFKELKEYAHVCGIPVCESAPLQRSSFKAADALEYIRELRAPIKIDDRCCERGAP